MNNAYIVATARNAIRIGEKLTPSAISSGAFRTIEDVVKTSLQGMNRSFLRHFVQQNDTSR
jgi:hypothetical protein